MKEDLNCIELRRGTIIMLTSRVDNARFSNLFLLQECFVDGFSCALTQITGVSAGQSRLVPKDATQFNGCSVCITACELKEAIISLYETWECEHIKILANHIELKHIQSCLLPQQDSAGYGRGSIFIVTDHYDGKIERDAYMLKESDDDEYEFQILQVSGEYAGWSPGYLRCKTLEQRLTREELWKGILFNFYEPEKDSLLLYPEHLVQTCGDHLIKTILS